MNKKIRNLWLETQNSKFKKPPILLLELKKASQSFMFFTLSKILLTFSLYTRLPNSHFTFSLFTFQISKHTLSIFKLSTSFSQCVQGFNLSLQMSMNQWCHHRPKLLPCKTKRCVSGLKKKRIKKKNSCGMRVQLHPGRVQHGCGYHLAARSAPVLPRWCLDSFLDMPVSSIS